MKRVIYNLKTDFFIVEDSYIIDCFNRRKDLFGTSSLLKNFEVLSVELDQTRCVFTNKLIDSYGTLYTDGNWIWSADLNYYTENFNFIWPDEFLETTKNDRKPISPDDLFEMTKQYSLDKIDLESFDMTYLSANGIRTKKPIPFDDHWGW